MTASSAQRKFMRGVEQIRQLLAEADAFEQRDAYVFRSEIESRSAQHVTYRCFASEREAPPDDWALRAGEAIQNLRSSLDHMVYAASSGQEMTQFPIFTSADTFKKKAPAMLTGVPEPVRAVIERAQPYNNYPPDPAGTMLEQLRLLSNLDKHRTLATVASAVQHEGVGLGEGVTMTWQQPATNRPLGIVAVGMLLAAANKRSREDEPVADEIPNDPATIVHKKYPHTGVVHDLTPAGFAKWVPALSLSDEPRITGCSPHHPDRPGVPSDPASPLLGEDGGVGR